MKIIRTAIWLKKDLDKLLQFYGTAPPAVSGAGARNIPYLPGFEKAYYLFRYCDIVQP